MNYYQRLGVPKNADLATIKKAYRTQIARHHPDKQGDGDDATLLNVAYQTLKDPAKRAKYDQSLSLFDASFVVADFRQTAYQAGQRVGKLWRQAQSAWQKSVPLACVIDLQTAYQGGAVALAKSQLRANIPSGVTHGDVLQVPTERGVAWVKISIKDPASTVKATDVYHSVAITASLAKTGGVVELPSPFSLRIKLPKNLTYPAKITLSGRGIPAFLGRRAGDLHLTFWRI